MISLTESEKFYELMFIVDGPYNPLTTVEEVFQKIKKGSTASDRYYC
jgi:hypothetical protein